MLAVASTYYSGNATIDQHNRICQQQLKLEKMLQVQTWDHCVNLSILGISNVDTYNFGKAMGWWSYDPNTFYKRLSEQMIDNYLAGVTTRGQCKVVLPEEQKPPAVEPRALQIPTN